VTGTTTSMSCAAAIASTPAIGGRGRGQALDDLDV
jgi:hypothetical protein